MKTIKVDKVILYYMDRVDHDAGTLPGECADFIFHKCND